MRTGPRLLTSLALALCLLAPAASVLGNGDPAGSGETRSVPTYGYGGDDFTDPANTTVYGSANVSGGNLTLNDVYLDTNFDDGTLQGWNIIKSTAEASAHYLRLNTGMVMQYVSFDNFTMDFNVKIAKLDVTGSMEGFRYHFLDGSNYQFTCVYENYNDTLTFQGTVGITDVDFKQISWDPTTDRWYHFKVEHTGYKFDVFLDSIQVSTISVPNFYNINQIAIGAQDKGDIYFDNIVVRTDDGHGHAVTGNVTLPHNRLWDRVEIDKTEHPLGTVRFSVLRPYANRVFPRHSNITDSSRDITDILVGDTDRIYLEFWMDGLDHAFPTVDWWRVHWRPDPPRQVNPIPQLKLSEDEPIANALKLSSYFADWYTGGARLLFNVSHESDPSHVHALVDGYNLSIELPTRDWHGTETIRVNCSDGEFVTESADITVVVSPVNDPPVLALPDSFEAVEGEESVLNLTGYITDVDTPMSMMTVGEDSPNCTVSGLELHFWYTVGSVTDQVLVSVSDREYTVDATLNVTVVNVNDAPVVAPVPVQDVVEEAPHLIDLSPYISDEDNATADLRVMSDDPNVTSIDGRVLTILFAEASEPTTVSFTVTDGLAAVAGVVPVRVEAVNDPPVVLTVGGMDASAPLVLRLNEGLDGLYEVVVSDVDSLGASFSVDSDLEGVAIHTNGTLRVSTVRGDVGTYTAVITVDDLDGGTAEVNVTIEVANVNDPPSVPEILSPANGTVVEEGTNVTFEARYSDLDTALGQVLTIVWRSNVSGELRRLTSGDAASFTVNALVPGSHIVTVTVSDGEYERSASVTVVVEAKELPPPDGDGGISAGVLVGIAIVVIAACGVVGLVVIRSRKKS